LKPEDACSGSEPNRQGQDTLPAELLKVSAVDPDKHAIKYAADFISRGQVVGVPTDTFYGLATDPFNLAAIEEIYRVKGRPEDRALPILVNSIEQAITLARDVPPQFLTLAQKFWPGALTLLVDASRKLPLKITANTRRAALRWPASAVVSALIDQLGSPVTGTSANISGQPSCSNAEDLMMQLGDRLPLILDSGETGSLVSSTIVDLSGDGWQVVRQGLVSEQEIERALEE
jgi:tRNA threonylcarbamoyl adenosine modification protein (Sua5/YciO/YrdC/YwlC family)